MSGLSLFDPDGRSLLRPRQRPRGSSLASLEDFFRDHFLADLSDRPDPAAELTIGGYHETVRWWTRLIGQVPLSEISRLTVTRFGRQLGCEPGRRPGTTLSVFTVRRHLSNVRAILRAAAEYGYLDRAPQVQLPRRRHDPPGGDLELEAIGAMHRAAQAGALTIPATFRCCGSSTETPGNATSRAWALFVLLAYFTGVRAGALLRLSREHFRPLPAGGAELSIPAELQKRRRGQWQYVHPAAWRLVEPLPVGLLFRWPALHSARTATRRNALSYLGKCHTRHLVSLSYQSPAGSALHGYRKAHATQLALINPLAAQISLNHSASIMSHHYANWRVILTEAIRRLPDPT